MWALGTKLGASERATRSLNLQAIMSASDLKLFIITYIPIISISSIVKLMELTLTLQEDEAIAVLLSIHLRICAPTLISPAPPVTPSLQCNHQHSPSTVKTQRRAVSMRLEDSSPPFP